MSIGQLCMKVWHLLKAGGMCYAMPLKLVCMVDVVCSEDVVQKSNCGTNNDHCWQLLLAAVGQHLPSIW